MKKILLITTGGTIASAPTDEGLAPVLSNKELLHLISGIVQNYDVHVKELFQLDSSNIQPEEWKKKSPLSLQRNTRAMMASF